MLGHQRLGQFGQRLVTDDVIPDGDGVERNGGGRRIGIGSGGAPTGRGSGDPGCCGAEIEQQLVGADAGIGATARQQAFDRRTGIDEIARQRLTAADRRRQSGEQPGADLASAGVGNRDAGLGLDAARVAKDGSSNRGSKIVAGNRGSGGENIVAGGGADKSQHGFDAKIDGAWIGQWRWRHQPRRDRIGY